MRWLKQFLLRIGARGRRFVLGSGLAVVLVAVICGVMLRGEKAQAVGAALRNPLSVFASRSPGVRLGGALYQTKPKVAAAPRGRVRPVGLVPRERVLSTGRSRPAPPASFADSPPIALLGTPGLMSGSPIDGPSGNGSPAFEVPPFGFGDTPGFTAGSGNQPGGETPGTGGPGTGSGNQPGSGSGTGPGSAVPEIATWMMMIVGLGAAGQALRRRGAKLDPASREADVAA